MFPELQEKHYDECIERAQRCIRTIRRYREEDMENRDEVVGTLYSYMGLSYMGQEKYDLALRCHDKDLQLAKKR